MTEMKKLFCAIFALCLSAVLALSALAETVATVDGITAHFSDVFTVFTKDNIESKADRAAELSENLSELEAKLSKDYLFYAVAPQMGWTAFMTAGETDISRAIVDLADFSDEQTAEQALIGSIKSRASEVKEIRKGAALFYRLTFLKGKDAEDTGGSGEDSTVYSAPAASTVQSTDSQITDGQSTDSMGTVDNADNRIMYITVMNGKVYTLVFIEQSAELSKNAADSADYIFSSLEYTVDSETVRVKDHKKRTFNILLAVCAPLAAVAVFFIVRSIKKDIERAKQEQSLRNNMRKKPRR